MVGGLTGLAGIVVVLWCQLRGWPKDTQRSISQPVSFAAFVVSAISLGIAGDLPFETLELYMLGLPLVVAGTWIGLRLYGCIDEANFRRVVLLLLLGSGISLIEPSTRLTGSLALARQPAPHVSLAAWRS